MCGIDTVVIRLGGGSGSGSDALLLEKGCVPETIYRRGPDASSSIVYNSIKDTQIRFTSSVLHLRGKKVTVQPVESENFILQWNGEIYDGIAVSREENDTMVLLNALEGSRGDASVETILSLIKGEFAFVLLDKRKKQLYYGRDCFGRRSLIISSTAERSILLSSIVNSEGSKEVAADGIYCFDLTCNRDLTARHIPWSTPMVSPISLELASVISDELVLTETISRLKVALERRTLSIPHLGESSSDAAPLAILFSGGIDSVILAIIADKCLPPSCPIDLINVAFQNERYLEHQHELHKSQSESHAHKQTTAASASSSDHGDDFGVPDRVSGLRAWEELCSISPERKWNFVKVDVTRNEYFRHRSHVARLMRPSETVMDLSIAIALWFAARGTGTLSTVGESYQSTAKVILVGMGADEQLGGYARHRTAYSISGHLGVAKEIQKELDRISTRNLGRDDRCISDHGREARFPFLDEDFVNFLGNLAIPQKCNLALPRGKGEKLLLRRIAKHYGFSDQVAYLPKRAIQFGAKTAKLEDNNHNGQDTIDDL